MWEQKVDQPSGRACARFAQLVAARSALAFHWPTSLREPEDGEKRGRMGMTHIPGSRMGRRTRRNDTPQ